MLKFFLKNWRKILFFSLLPIPFIGIIKLCIKFLPGEMIGTIDGWLGFLGGYFGVLGTFGAVCWQIENEKIQKNSQYKIFLKYILKTINFNLKIDFSLILSNLYSYNSIVDEKDDLFYFIKLDDTLIQNYLSLFIEKNHTSVLELQNYLHRFSYYQEKYYSELKDKLIMYDTLSKKCPTPDEAKNKNNENLIIADFLNLSYYINKTEDYQIYYNIDSEDINIKSKEEKFWIFYKKTLELLRQKSINSKEDKEIYTKFSTFYKSDSEKRKVFDTYIFYLSEAKKDIEDYLKTQ